MAADRTEEERERDRLRGIAYRAAHKEELAAKQKAKYQRPEVRAAKKAYDAQRTWPTPTPRTREKHNAEERLRRANETPEQREKRLTYARAWYAAHPDYNKSEGRRTAHREYKRRVAREKPEETRAKARIVKLKSTYNLSLERFEAMRAAQGDVCAVCGQPETAVIKGAPLLLSVDHDHSCCPGKKSCGKCIRGLLCFRCNAVMGNLNDDPALLRAMLVYLDRPA